MKFPAFAYYKSTKIVLAGVACLTEFLLMLMIARIILAIFKVKANKRQYALFAFCAGTLLQAGWSYLIYFIHGAVSFTSTQFVLVTTPNPFVALLYCWLAIKVFRLSAVRSINMMSYVYLFWSLIKNMIQIWASFLFVQTHGRWNYLVDIIQQLAGVVIFFIIYCIVINLLKLKKINVAILDNRFFNPNKELLFYFLKATFVYIVFVLFHLTVADSKAATILAFTVNSLFIVIIVCADSISYYRQVIENDAVHISSLFKGIQELQGIKHDFNNILQTYTGFIDLGKIDSLRKYHYSLVETITQAGAPIELGKKTHENPALMTLLGNKVTYAQKSGVTLSYSLLCDVSDFYVDNMDLCRMLACLLDNAIEGAKASEEKKIYFSVESKSQNSKLFIITNSVAKAIDVDNIVNHGVSSKEGHSGIGLSTVRSIVNKYGNCSFRIESYALEFSVYIEVTSASRI